MKKIKIEAVVKGGIEKVWEYWNGSEHIPNWAFASEDWGASVVRNDLREGGSFSTRMAANDGSAAFDFSGTYTKVVPYSEVSYTLDDGRAVSVAFKESDGGTVEIVQEFEMEQENSEEMQRAGWQAFLDNFKKYAEREVMFP
ncbi:MAG: SRPBCC domain-containing protein [Patescibacteria group bacterium]